MNVLNITFIFLSITVCNCKRLICKPVICPPCQMQKNLTVEQSKIIILEAGGPSDGICEQGEKWIYYGKDFGLNNNACCCMPVQDYPLKACDPMGSGTNFCPLTPVVYKDETIEDYYLRIGCLLGKSAPTNGCCKGKTFRSISPPAVTGQSADICTCFEKNMRVAKWHSSSSSSSSERRHWMRMF